MADGEGPVVGESEAVREAVDDVATVVVSSAALVHVGQHAQTAQLLGAVAVSAPLGAGRDAPVLHPRALRPAAAHAGSDESLLTTSTLSLSLLHEYDYAPDNTPTTTGTIGKASDKHIMGLNTTGVQQKFINPTKQNEKR